MEASTMTMRIGYSYLRYSSAQQGDGDSIRRQTKGTADWCKRNDVQLDTSRTYLDRGRSAYHGRHRQRGGALAAFLSEVERGDIPRGSVLIIENLDRLSRENPWDAVSLLTSLVNAGISVVTLSPAEMVYERGSNLTSLVLAVVEFGRGYSESKAKSDRSIANWDQKREAIRQTGAILTRRLPSWIEERGGKLTLIPGRANLVRRMFDLALRGYGLSLIVRELTQDKVPVWGSGKQGWSKAYIHKIISRRTVLGEYQPTRNGKKHGDPLPDYYPAVVDETTWFQAQAALARRKEKRGPVGKGTVATLFGGILRDAITHDHLRIKWQTGHGQNRCRQNQRVLVTARSIEGAGPILSFPSVVFEEAILKLLKEVNPADVLGREPESESAAVAAELAAKEQRMRQIEAELTGDGDDVPTLVRVVRSLSGECDGLRKRLAAIRQKEANPRSVAWSEALTLIDVAKDESQRLRLRELLRTIIEEIWILIVPRQSHRLAAVQIYFRGDGRRDYLIHYQSAGYRRAGGWWAGSLPSKIAPSDLDLRRKKDVRDLTKTLAAIDVDLLTAAMREKVANG
jgi:DNA invertase Pin-like site-specific DNA recombinase